MMNIKDEKNQYLKKLKLSTAKVMFTQFLILILFITIWQLLSDKEIINSFLCSSPKKVIETLITLWKNGDLFTHVIVTLKEILIGFILGSFIGIVVAAILWLSNFVAKVLDPYLTILNSLPKVALGPIIIIWVGANQNSIIIMALLISVISSIINIYTGFKSTDIVKIKLLKSFGANKYQIFKNLIFPSNINTIISTLKINLSMTFVGVMEV